MLRYKVTKHWVKFKGIFYKLGELLPTTFTEKDRQHSIYTSRISAVDIPDLPNPIKPTEPTKPIKPISTPQSISPAATSVTRIAISGSDNGNDHHIAGKETINNYTPPLVREEE